MGKRSRRSLSVLNNTTDLAFSLCASINAHHNKPAIARKVVKLLKYLIETNVLSKDAVLNACGITMESSVDTPADVDNRKLVISQYESATASTTATSTTSNCTTTSSPLVRYDYYTISFMTGGVERYTRGGAWIVKTPGLVGSKYGCNGQHERPDNVRAIPAKCIVNFDKNSSMITINRSWFNAPEQSDLRDYVRMLASDPNKLPKTGNDVELKSTP